MVFSSSKTVLFWATTRLDGAELTITMHPSVEDKHKYGEAETNIVLQLTPEHSIEIVLDYHADTRKDALEEVKGKVQITNAFKLVHLEGTQSANANSQFATSVNQMHDRQHLVFSAGSAEEARQWCNKITRKIELLKVAAGEELADPVPEQAPEVIVETDCLARSQSLAREAVERFECWEASVDHSAPNRHTDDCIAQLRTQASTTHTCSCKAYTALHS
jgi:hypothetical protein